MVASSFIEAKDQNEDVIELDEIIVSATRTPASLDNIPASSSVVSEKQIRSSTATDLGGFLRATNILQIMDYGPSSLSMASMRGSSSEQVLVLLDGERINSSLSGDVNLDNIPITCAKRIEVVRGGYSAMYGADAVGGIINIITRQPARATARVWSNLGDYNSVSCGVEASEQVRALSGILSLSKMRARFNFPFEDKFGKTMTRENADYEGRSVFGKVKWDIAKSAILSITGDHTYSDRGDPGPIGQYTPDAVKKDKTNGIRMDMEQSLTEGGLYKLSLYRRDSTLRYTNPPSDDTHKTDAMGAEFQAHLLQNLSIPLIFGVSFRDENIDSTAIGDQARRTFSGYVQQELGKNMAKNPLRLSRVAVFPALRWDHYSDFEAGISPKLGFLASFGQGRIATIRASAGGSYRAPTLNELYWQPDAFAYGNPDLKPERAKDADIGIHIHLKRWNSRLNLASSVSYFWSSTRDSIHWTPGKEGKWSPMNLSRIKSEGLESDANISVFDLLSLGVNYTFIKAEDALKRQLIYRPKHSLGYVLRIGTDDLWGQVQGLCLSRRYYTVQNTKWLEPFMKHDFQLGVERRLWNVANIGLIFEVKNIFDTRYQLVADYPLPGREWNVKTSIGTKGE